jgi:hypothetical protein
VDSANQHAALCGQNVSFEVGTTVSLLQHIFGIVGEGMVIELSLVGHWRGVDILQGSKSFVWVRPINILEGAYTLSNIPRQVGFNVLGDMVGRTMLWRSEDILDLSMDPPIHDSTNAGDVGNMSNDAPFIKVEEWLGMIIERCNV